MRLRLSVCLCLSSAVALLGLSSPALRADTVVTYNVSGTIPSAIYAFDGTTVIPPSSLSGTIAIDQTANTIATDVFLSGGIVDEYTRASSRPITSTPMCSIASPTAPPRLTFPVPPLHLAGLDLEIPATAFSATGTIPLITPANLSIYEPGAQITTASNVGQGEGQNIDFTSGDLTPATDSPVPEPSSLVLLCTGAGALAAAMRRLRHA